jgi:hypothetical protein
MDVDALLARIGAEPPAAPTGVALAALHRAYAYAYAYAYAWTMPSEDYDIQDAEEERSLLAERFEIVLDRPWRPLTVEKSSAAS